MKGARIEVVVVSPDLPAQVAEVLGKIMVAIVDEVLLEHHAEDRLGEPPASVMGLRNPDSMLHVDESSETVVLGTRVLDIDSIELLCVRDDEPRSEEVELSVCLSFDPEELGEVIIGLVWDVAEMPPEVDDSTERVVEGVRIVLSFSSLFEIRSLVLEDLCSIELERHSVVALDVKVIRRLGGETDDANGMTLEAIDS